MNPSNGKCSLELGGLFCYKALTMAYMCKLVGLNKPFLSMATRDGISGLNSQTFVRGRRLYIEGVVVWMERDAFPRGQ